MNERDRAKVAQAARRKSDVGREIGAAFAAIQADEAIEIQEQRYREAKAVVATIPSGTHDDELTARQRHALDQYEDAIRRLSELRDA